MKVINNNCMTYPRRHTCENCGSELEYEEADLYDGPYGAMYIKCPVCEEENMVICPEDSGMKITPENIKFPTHFHHISVETGAKDVCNNDFIRAELREAINYFRKNPDKYDLGSWVTGNLFLYIEKTEDEKLYEVTISKDFYTTVLPFESEDY